MTTNISQGQGATHRKVECSNCGRELQYIPADILLGESWLGTGCPGCHRVYCNLCMDASRSSPCPNCGTKTIPAMGDQLRNWGVL